MSAANIQGRCPACGRSSLFVASGGWITCGLDRCPKPTAVSDLLAAVATHHTVTIRAADYTVQHPLIETVNGTLHDCPLDRYMRALSGPPRQVGVYHVHGDVTCPETLLWEPAKVVEKATVSTS